MNATFVDVGRKRSERNCHYLFSRLDSLPYFYNSQRTIPYYSLFDQFDFRIPDFEQDKQLQCYICTTNESDDCLDTDEAVLKKYIGPCVMPAGIAMTVAL